MQDTSSEEWNQPRCWSEPSRYRSAGKRAFGRVRALQHREVRGARIEPDVDGVLDLLVVRRVRAEEFPGGHRLPGLDAALLDAPGDLLDQLQRARMQRAGLLVHEERHRHAPLARARQRPVGPVGDHAVQPRLAPGRKELGGLDAAQRARSFAQAFRRRSRALVHAGEPLDGGAQDHRRLVAPAVHVAVHVLPVHREQRALLLAAACTIFGFASQIDRPPNSGSEAANLPSPMHRREDLVVLHAVAAAGLEVLDAVGRRRVHDAGAGIQRHVVAEVDRRRAVVERVPEADVLQRPALRLADQPSRP